MRGGELHPRRLAGLVGLEEARGADAPAVAGLQAGEAELGPRGGKIVAHLLGKGEELRRHHRADGVAALVRLRGVAAAVAEETRHRIGRAGLEVVAQHVGRRVNLENRHALLPIPCIAPDSPPTGAMLLAGRTAAP